jgi:hypothetical protein
MAWIQSHQALSRHKKTLALAAYLRTDRYKVLGHLHELWWWGIDNADTNGQIGAVPAEVIAEAAGWPVKDAERFVESLVSAGFMDRTDDQLSLHNWFEYAGKLNVQRDENKERMRRKRAAPPPHPPNTNGTSAAHVQRTTTARAPAREEKRREDTYDTTSVVSVGSADPPEVRPRLQVVGEPVPKPKPRQTPVGTLLDKIKALDATLEVFGDHGFTGSKLKANPDVDLDQVAEAYVSFRHGEWPGSRILRESGGLAWVIGDLGGYVAWRSGQRKPRQPNDDVDPAVWAHYEEQFGYLAAKHGLAPAS